MKKIPNIIKKSLLFTLIFVFVNALQARNQRDTIGIGARIMFSENLGQWQREVLFRAQMHGITLFVEQDCFTFVVQHPDNANLHHPRRAGDAGSRYRHHAYRLRFDGSRATGVEGTDRESGHENYFIGNDPTRWATGVGVYNSLLYHDLYDGIDLRLYAATQAMKYDFIVRPGASPDAIAMRYEGVDNLRLQNGNLIVRTSVLDIVELKPYAYQMVGEQQVEVAARYILKDNRVTFGLGDYDTTLPLIIDPYLHFSTYTGSTADNWGTTGCYDSQKNTYTSGLVFGVGYPTSLGPYDDTYNGNADVGIFKFDSSGHFRLYATYLGGSNADMPHSMFVNSFDELVIFGTTGSTDFPTTPGAYDPTFNGGTAMQYEGTSTINFPQGSDLFIARFNSSGSQLQASTYVGGTGNDGLNYRNAFSYEVIMLGNDSLYYNYGDGARGELITDDLNNIYVGSTTFSTDFPVTANSIQPTPGGQQDGVVFKIDYNLQNLMWSTYLGGGKDDAIYSIDCDPDYNVVVAGGTNSHNFPTTPGAYHTSYCGGSADGFVTKISYYGSAMMASTLFGSTAYDQSYFVRCSKSGDIFLFGQTEAYGSTLIHNANYNVPSSGQFLARLRPGLDTLVWSTVFGDGSGEPNLSPTAFMVDICNRIYLSGWGRIFLGRSFGGTSYAWNTHGTSNLTITPDAYQDSTDGQDFYIMALDMDANALVYATFFGELHSQAGGYYSGGDHVDGGTSRFDRHGTLYQSVCASCSGGDDFPVTTGAYGQHNNSSNCNNAIFRINLTDDFPVAEFVIPHSVCAPAQVSLINTGRGDSFLWDFGDGTTSTLTNPEHTYATPGLYTIRLVAYMADGCRPTDTASHDLLVLGAGHIELDTLKTCPGSPLQIGMRPSPGCTYTWIGATVSDPTISNPMVFQPGLYVLIIHNGNCIDTAFQWVEVGETEAHIVGDTLTCSVPTTLTAVAQGSGLSFQWSSNRWLADTLNADMSVGGYSFTPNESQWLYMHVVDDRGCYKTDSIHVRFYRVVDSLRVAPPLCPGTCDGGACVITNSQAVPPLHYNWSNLGMGWSNDSCISDLCAGAYTSVFRDGNGCVVTTDFTVADPLPPAINATVQHIRCHETCSGSISIDVSGPSASYSLLWLDDSSTTPSRTDLCPGTYILQVADLNGCLFFDTVEILDNIDLSLTIYNLMSSCPDQCSGSATVHADGGYEPYTYSWSSGEEDSTATGLCGGTAVVTVTDAYGCQKSDSVEVGIQHSFDGVHVWADDSVVFSGHSTTLHVTPIPHGSYWWSPSTLLSGAATTDPVATLDDSALFVVVVTDSVGCTHTDTLLINCISVNCGEPNIFIPNAFTPNNDGKNDQLCFSGEWIDEFSIAIFTRWGEKVFEATDFGQCWDGRYKDNWCMPGVYVYHCRIKCQDGQVSQFKGDITLIR